MLESTQVATKVVVVAEDGEGDEAEAVLELVLLQHLFEELRHLAGWVVESTATEGTQHEAVVAVHKADAIDGANLVAGDDLGHFGHVAILGESDFKLAPEVQCRIGDDANLERMFHKRVFWTSLAEDRNVRRVDRAEVERLSKRVVVPFTVCIVELVGIVGVKGENGPRQRAATADGLLLGASSRGDTAAGMTSAGEVEQGGGVTLVDEALGRLQAVVLLHHDSGASLHPRCINARQLLVVANATVNHALHVEADALA